MGKTFYTLCIWVAGLIYAPINLQAERLLDGAPQKKLLIGWASADITPSKPVLLRGQLYARFSEGVLDPITTTILAMESFNHDKITRVIMVSCDLVAIPDDLRDRVRKIVIAKAPELTATDIMLNATHTHSAPFMTTADIEEIYGLPFEWITGGQDAMTPKEYLDFIVEAIAEAALRAWENRAPGGISYGLSKAVVGHNRLQADMSGKSLIYGNTGRPEFSHIEGYEDHSLNLLYTWNQKGALTGVLINIPVPSQVSESTYLVSADFWAETRALLKQEVKRDLFILPQVSAAGDQSPHVMWDNKAEERMQKLMSSGKDKVGKGSMGQRKQIARYITDGVKAILPYMKGTIEWNPLIDQRTEEVALSRRLLGKSDLEKGDQDEAEWKVKYDSMLAKITERPELRKEKRWYRDITITYSRYSRGKSVRARYELEKKDPKLAVEVKVIRIGDMAIATNPFELYLDYGIRIKVKSPAVQTFLGQLTGSGTYLPTQRSINGGAYGAVPASTIFGPEGGDQLVEKTVDLLYQLWGKENPYKEVN